MAILETFAEIRIVVLCRYAPSTHIQETNQLLHNLYDLPLYHTSSWEEQDFHTISTILIIVTNRCLASRSFHPTESLFKPKPLPTKRESELHTSRKNERFEMDDE